MAHLLLIDDDPALIPKQVRQVFPAPAHRVEVAGTGAEGLERVRAEPPDVILLDLRLPDQSGLDVYQQIRRIDARIPVIFVTMAKTADAAIEAMQQGAYDYLFKPLDLHQLAARGRRGAGGGPADARAGRGRRDRRRTPTWTAPSSAPARPCARCTRPSAASPPRTCPVLITGESGTGKELVARAIYQHGPRAKAPFLALNCAAIPENLLESELFGHEKGAFTGADRRRIGKFEQCNGGTLFLDEIGDMPLALQAKMLRVLQEQAFERVGGNETIRTDVRLIAATHRDLKAWSAEGKFRPDLYYRLSVFTIHLPPLRERGDDLPMLVQLLPAALQPRTGAGGPRGRPGGDGAALRSYSWPGNIRELQSVLKQALLQATGPVLLPAFLPELTAGDRRSTPRSPQSGANPGLEAFIGQRLGPETQDLYAHAQRELDRILLPRVLAYAQGSQRQAARVLGIAPKTLRQKLRELGLNIPRPADGDDDEQP